MSLNSVVPTPLIIAPTAFEYDIIQHALRDDLKMGKIRIGMCGVGERLAFKFCRKLLPEQVSHLILLGWAGGLVPDLQAGDVVCANQALTPGKPALTLHPIASVASGAILTSPLPLINQSQKQAAHSSGAIAVEMEAYPFAEWANSHNIPFIHSRVILDTLTEALPDMAGVLDAYGQVRLVKFIMQIVMHPRQIIPLWRLTRRTISLNSVLARLALETIQPILNRQDQLAHR
jgi:hypothetical protein